MSDEPKTYSVKLTAGANADVRAIKSYIELQLLEPAAARRTVAGILATADALATMPMRNRVFARTSSGVEVRLARSGNYSLVYLVIEDDVRIVAVLYSASDIKARLSRVLAEL